MTKVISLLDLRKQAVSLGIKDYNKFSKEELIKVIEEKKKEKDASQVVETDIESSEQEIKEVEQEIKEVEEKLEVGDVKEISAEEAEKLDKDQKLPKTKKSSEKKKEKDASQVSKELKKEKKEKPKKEKKEKSLRKTYKFNYTPKGDKPEKLGSKSMAVYDELLKNEGLSTYQIAKKHNTYFSVVDKIINKYFEVEKVEVN